MIILKTLLKKKLLHLFIYSIKIKIHFIMGNSQKYYIHSTIFHVTLTIFILIFSEIDLGFKVER